MHLGLLYAGALGQSDQSDLAPILEELKEGEMTG